MRGFALDAEVEMAGATPGTVLHARAAMPVAARARRGLGTMWAALPPTGRVALLGVLASALVAVALGIFIPVEIRRHLIVAEGRGLQAAVAALEPSLPDLTAGPLSAEEIAATDRLVDRTLLDSDHVRAKLWSLEGVVLYSDAAELIGRQFADVVPRVRAAAAGVMSEVSDLADPENELEREYAQLVEFYVPVRDATGRAIAVFEIYEDVAFLEEALGRITLATWLAIGSGLSILLIFLVLLVLGAVRSISRDRTAAEARAAELAVLVGAAEALASSLEPAESFARLEASVRQALGLSRLSIEPLPAGRPAALSTRLRDGSWLVAEREESPLTEDDGRILRSVANNLDAALANAALYAEVRDAAQARRALLRQVAEAHEDERRHIVGELHDSLAGELIRVLYGIRGIAARGAGLPTDVAAELAALEGLVGEAEQELREFMNRVRPASLDEFGLKAALEGAVDRFRQESHLDVRLRVRGEPAVHSPEVQLVVLRAAEEALLNVRKHARAARVRLAVNADGPAVRLAIDDDGVGWAAAGQAHDGRGLGLAYLRERVVGFGGTLRAEPSHLGGARLVVEIPAEVP